MYFFYDFVKVERLWEVPELRLWGSLMDDDEESGRPAIGLL